MMKKPCVILLLFIVLGVTPLDLLVAGPDTTIVINAISGMQYDQVQIKVRPNTKVKLVLSNVDDMSHNLVITKPESRVSVVEKALALSERGPGMDFIPDIPEVLWSIPVLAPGEEKSVTFQVPGEETILPYVCTFPGHGYIMYGAIYVTDGELPPIESDSNIPQQRRKKTNSNESITDQGSIPPHPYNLDPPYYYRIFMPDASPASVAVRLTDEISFCWDAGPCQLLYAWKGGFIDNSVAWKGHKNTESRILGTIFYTEHDNNPILIGSKDQRNTTVEFMGYRLKNRNPEFHYRAGGVEVYEHFKVSGDGKKLLRHFRIPQTIEPVQIKINGSVTATKGRITNGYLTLTPEESRQFTLEIPIKNHQ